MAHIHNVYDSDKHFIIDAVTMVIQNTSEKVKLSQYNHKSERFTFEIPRYIEGHDMSLCNKVQVHFNNVKSDKTVISKGVYEVDDLEVAEDENTVIFSWLISRKATLNEGTLNFCIRFACVADDATVEYARYTDIYKGITITESLFNSEHVIVDYSDILEAWKKELEELAASGGGLTEVAWEDIKNKPFGEIKYYPDVICDETATDRVVTEPFSIPNLGDGFYYVKVGELPTTAAEYLSKLNEFTLNNGEEYSEDIIVNEYENGAVVVSEFVPLWFIVAVDVPNAEFNGGTFPESGLYFIYNEGTKIGVQKATFDGVLLLDEKYLPENYTNTRELLENHKSEFEDHKSEFEDHKSEFASQKADFASHKTEFKNHKADFENHKSEFEDHKSEFASQKADFASHKIEFQNHKADFENYKTNFESYKTNFEGHKLEFEGHKSEFESHKGDRTHLPETTETDAGKFLQVNIWGDWVAITVPMAEGAEF